MKKSELIFTAILVPVDYIMLVLAGLAAWSLRTSELVANWRPVLFSVNLPFDRYFGLIALMALFWIAIFALSGLYAIKRANGLAEDFVRIIIASSAGLAGIIIYSFLRREWFDSRFLIFAAWILAILFAFFGRIIVRAVQKIMVKKGVGRHNVLIVGNGPAEDIMAEIKTRPSMGYNLAGYFSELEAEKIKEFCRQQKVDDIILINSDFSREDILDLIEFCEERHINFKFVPNLFQALTINTDFDVLGGVPMIELKRTALDGWGKIIKRAIDIIGSVFGLIFFSPLLAVIAILVKLDSPGPVIYKNERVGPKGKHFNAYKFRSMKIEYCTGGQYDKSGEASVLEDQLVQNQSGRKGPVFKIMDDPRRTKLGRFLEKTSLDELPQFFNVLIGNMSLVGPRPHMPKEVAGYQKWHKKVFNIKPGITGLGQISGRSDIDFDEEVKLDTYYIENWSLWLDIKILLKTPLVVLFRRHR